MLNSKQRAYLAGMASHMTSIFQIGKGGLTPELTIALDEALEKRELIKISVLKNCPDEPAQLAEKAAERTRSRIVKVIGRKIVLFRVSKKKPVIKLPQ